MLKHKLFLRNLYREKVRRMAASKRRTESLRIARRVARLPAFRRARVVAAYLSLPFEVDTRPLLDLCRAAGKRVAVPVTFPATGRIRFAFLEPRARLKPNVYGIAEPAEKKWVSTHAIDVVIAPGSAFTRRGVRLGAGGGYYDRFLAAFRGASIGVAYSCQLPTRLPKAAHDVAVDQVATAARIFSR